MPPDPLRQRLAALEQAGAEAFDAPTLRFVRGLLARSDAYAGGAAERLRARAGARLDDLARRFVAARNEATEAVEALASRGFDREAADAAIAGGDVLAVRRAVRRYGAAPSTGRTRRRMAVVATTRVRKGRRRAPAAASPAAPRPTADRYRASLAELVTGLSIERARRILPAEPGPYNGQTVAARLLENAAALSAVYAHSQLERMRELAALALLPAPAEAKPRKPRRR